MCNVFTYIAIPSIDFERAIEFYSAITDGRIIRNPNVPFPMAYFVDKENREKGHLFHLPPFKPSADGPIVYMELYEDLNETLNKINNAGGQTIMPKTLISKEKGFWALFMDTEVTNCRYIL